MAFWAGGLAVGIKFQAVPKFTHPTHLTGGVADHQSVIGNIFSHYCASTNEGIGSDVVTADDGGIGSDAGSFSHVGFGILAPAVHAGAGVGHIRKHARWAQEDVVVASDAGVDADVVLDFNVSAQDDVGGNHDVLAQVAVLANSAGAHDVRKMPNLGTRANVSTFINNCSRMYRVTHGEILLDAKIGSEPPMYLYRITRLSTCMRFKMPLFSRMAFALLLLPAQLFGWGQTGHRVVGQIAENHLHAEAAAAVKGILGDESLAMCANWMDHIKSNRAYNHMNPWHYCTIPDGLTYETCDHPAEGDVIETITQLIQEIKSGSYSKAENEVMAVKMLAHLVGDLHQPLHVGNGTDKGGNDRKIKWFGESSNLHRVWDSDLIDHQQLSYTEYVAWVDHATAAEVTEWQSSSVVDWAHESQAIRMGIYPSADATSLGYSYNYDHIETLNKRLLQAGVRLAGIINELYTKPVKKKK